MAKKATDAVLETANEPEAATDTAAAEPAGKAQAGTCAAGFYIYIGPNIRKYIQTGTIYRGDRDNALAKAAEAVAAYPQVRTLIVSGDALPEARIRVRTPGNALYAAYKKLKGGR